MKHAEKLIERILFLEGVPEIARYDVIRVGTDIKEQFENDLQLEMKGVAHYNSLIELSVRLGDNGTRELAAPILTESEEHVDWLEDPALPASTRSGCRTTWRSRWAGTTAERGRRG